MKADTTSNWNYILTGLLNKQTNESFYSKITSKRLHFISIARALFVLFIFLPNSKSMSQLSRMKFFNLILFLENPQTKGFSFSKKKYQPSHITCLWHLSFREKFLSSFFLYFIFHFYIFKQIKTMEYIRHQTSVLKNYIM